MTSGQSLTIQPIKAFEATLSPPGSKSMTNRALFLAALADGESIVRRPLFADDTRCMIDGLGTLGFSIESLGEDDLRVSGKGGLIPAEAGTLSLGNSGTTMRSLAAACCLGRGPYLLDGVERMRQRPIGQLVDPLRELGARIEYRGEEGFPPLAISGPCRGGQISMAPTLSSQYITALLLIGPYLEGGLEIVFDGPITSRPYVAMTLRMMQQFGIESTVEGDWSIVRVPQGVYQAREYAVEPDASNATYFLAAAAVLPDSKCTIEGLGADSLQGDVGFADLLQQMGAGLVFGRDFITILAPPAGETLQGVDVDLNDMPDVAQTLAVVALFAEGRTIMRNIGNLRVKETDRMAALECELTKLGASITIDGDDLIVDPPAAGTQGKLQPATIDTYDDHRMAMSFAIAGLRAPGVVINDPDCVNKTFPDFFDYLARLQPADA